MTRAEFGKCMALLEAGACHAIPATTLEVWYGGLGDLPVDALSAAVGRVLAERQYPGLPTMGDLRKRATEHVYGVIATPEQAFARLRQGISRYGSASIEERQKLRRFVGQSICDVVDGLGGWQRICDATGRERSMLYSQFRDAWIRFTERRSAERALPQSLRPSINFDPPTPAGVTHRRIGLTR